MNASPWQLALGASFDDLDEGLKDYFGVIPRGSVGVGHGTFDRVGTPHRWLWPIIAVLGRGGVAHAGWFENVEFTITNRPAGETVRAVRTFHFPKGDWSMRDEVSFRGGTLVDRLGNPAAVAARFRATVVDGTLELDSTSVAVRFGNIKLQLPRALAPRIRLSERRENGYQRISLTVLAPLIGVIYKYSGHFTYSVVPE